MEKFVSSWSDGEKLPDNYVFPPDRRPGKVVVATSKNIPIIDIGKAEGLDRSAIIQQVIQAGQEFGFFQVMNHGVPSALVNDTRRSFEEFFALPAEEKTDFCSLDASKNFIYLTSNVHFETEEVHNWRDTLRFNSFPLEECKKDWPLKPTNFRDIVGEYTVELENLGLRILELISEGLGLEQGYFTDKMSQDQFMAVHQYPICPDPSLTLGTRGHKDPGLISILLQGDVPGLQVLKDEEWVGVALIPDAFVINIGCVLQILSNGKLLSVEHRVVTSKSQSRISAAFFLCPEKDCVIEPAKAIVKAGNSPRYKSVRHGDLFQAFLDFYKGEIDSVFENYEI